MTPELKEKLKKKVGRNELCLCGSGKKHKRCCDGQKAQVRLARLLPGCSDPDDRLWIQLKIQALDEKEAILRGQRPSALPGGVKALVATTLAQLHADESKQHEDHGIRWDQRSW